MNMLYEFSIGRWLWDLYRNGPLLLGFWGGLNDAEVCSRMSGNSNAYDWLANNGMATQACENMIQRSFQGLSVTINSLMYVTAVMLVFATLRQWLVAKIMAKTFAYEFHKMQTFTASTPGGVVVTSGKAL